MKRKYYDLLLKFEIYSRISFWLFIIGLILYFGSALTSLFIKNSSLLFYLFLIGAGLLLLSISVLFFRRFLLKRESIYFSDFLSDIIKEVIKTDNTIERKIYYGFIREFLSDYINENVSVTYISNLKIHFKMHPHSIKIFESSIYRLKNLHNDPIKTQDSFLKLLSEAVTTGDVKILAMHVEIYSFLKEITSPKNFVIALVYFMHQKIKPYYVIFSFLIISFICYVILNNYSLLDSYGTYFAVVATLIGTLIFKPKVN